MKRPQNRMATERLTRLEPVIEPDAKPIVQKKIWPGPAVNFVAAICPNCGSAKNTIDESYKPEPTPPVIRKRLHTCSPCGNRFWSQQEIPKADL